MVALKSEGTKGGWEFYGGIREAPLDASIIKNLLSILREMDLAPKPGTATVLERALPSGLRRHELEALHVFPVRTLERQLGALLLGTSRPVPPSPEQETLLSSLANQLAIVLDNARLRRALKDHNLQLEATVRQRTSELRSLLEIGQAVCAHLDRHPLFHSVSAAVQSVVPFDRMGIILPSSEENGLLLYIFETHGGEARLRPGVTFPRAGTVPGWVLEHKQSFIGSSLKDFGAFPVSREILKQEGMQSNCVLPLLVEGGAVGALVFLGKEPDHFSSVQLPLLEEMASVVALALDNCLAYEEITRLKDQLAQENIYLQEEIKTEHNFDEIVGRSPALKKVLTRVEKVAPADSSVLINGETGTGKELIARAIHDLSQRKDRPLIKVNCAALPIGLIESELFGHEKGAFTGALTKKTGRFELAHQGTIFLDEIGDLPPEIQVKLLRILQEPEFERVGGTQTIKVDVRVIAATNRDLEKAVSENSFRSDLYYRLNVFPIHLPSLREREGDVPLLVQYFVNKHASKMGKRIEKVNQKTMRRLTEYAWPGNIRELENVIERSVILSSESILEIEDEFALPSSTHLDQEEKELVTLHDVERNHIVEILNQTGWVVEGRKGAARILDLHPNTLRGRMKKLGIKRA